MSRTFAIVEVFAIAGILDLTLILLLICVVRQLEKRLMRHTVPAAQARPLKVAQAK